MVAPFVSYAKRYSIGAFRFDATGVKQKPPYVNTSYWCSLSYAWGNNTYTDSVRNNSKTIATNLARKRLVDQLGDSSSLGATLTAERKETYGMLKSSLVTVFQSARALKKGDVVKAARLLGVAPPEKTKTVVKRTRSGKRRKVKRTVLVLPDGREVAKSLGNKWLWWSYGVKPLASDMYNSVDVLQREQPWKRIHGSGSGTDSNVWYNTSIKGLVITYTNQCKSKVSMSINVRVKNPNLFLANQLGLTNPVQWINEAIMFSFVIDWFSNLSQVISQMTDFVGLETSDPLTAFKSHQTNNTKSVRQGKVESNFDSYRVDMTRGLLIPAAKLRFAYERFQWQRGANAISLLVQFLKKNK